MKPENEKDSNTSSSLLPIKITRREVLIDGKNIGMVRKLAYSDGPGATPGHLILDIYSLDREIEIELESAITINKISLPPDISENLSITALRIELALNRDDKDLAYRLCRDLIENLRMFGWIGSKHQQTAEALDYPGASK